MSTFEFKLPDIGEGVMEGEIVKWLVSKGEAVAEDQPMVEVMTDKATVTITSPKPGTVLELAGEEGATIAVHSKLVVLQLDGDSASGDPAPAATIVPDAAPSEPAATAVGDIKEHLPGMDLGPPNASQAPAKAPAPGYFQAKPLATPATRKFARERGVDLRQVEPSGKHGRVTKDDVNRFAAADQAGEHQAAAAESAAMRSGPAGQGGAARPSPQPVVGQESETRTPLRGMRKRIFDAMSYSKHTAAHFTFVEECDVTELKAMRSRLKGRAADEGVKLTFLPFFVKAVVAALKRHPALNCAYDAATSEIVQRHHHHIGIASSTKHGLMVPVIKHADQKGLLAIARDIERLAEATKTGKVSPADLQGSTFTITSLGREGGYFATPILNMPEVGILGIHSMKQRPVVKNGQIVVGDVMLLSLSFDHRLIDGHVGAAFAYEIIRFIEAPELLMLED